MRRIEPIPLPENTGPVEISNLTGGQIQDILDHLLMESITPIILYSDIFDVQVEHILSVVARNRKRKLSAHDRELFISMLTRYLITPDRQEKIKILTGLKLERGFIYNFITLVLERVKDYNTLYQKYLVAADESEHIRLELKLAVIEKDVGIPKEYLFQSIHYITDYLFLMYEFRNSIVNNYIKYAYKQAKIFCSTKSENFDFNDVRQNFLTSIIKAIDKYDSSKGALTSYIKWWILNVQTSPIQTFGHEYGVAYTLPQSQKKHLAIAGSGALGLEANFGVSLDQIISEQSEGSTLSDFLEGDKALDHQLEHEQNLEIIRILAKKADPEGIARLYLGIPEYFTPREYRLMMKTMKKQRGKIKKKKKIRIEKL